MARAGEDLGLGRLDLDIALGNLRRRVLGLEQPATLGRYELLRRLGAGAMGVVYLGHDPTLDREVAIKHLHSQHADSPGTARAERHIQREAWAMARLTHANVVGVYEFGTEGQQSFIVMEYVRGVTLRAWMDAEPARAWTEVLGLLIGAGRGLAAAHDAGVIHRDFKPQNVLIDVDAGVAKVTDFGLAGPVGGHLELDEQTLSERHHEQLDDSTLLSINGVIMGTPAYMAPECHAGQVADARSDQFSFCVALYEALFGERPFVGSSYAELARAIQAGHLRQSTRARAVPSWIVAMLERGLAVEPEHRWPSMSALLDALCDDPSARRRRRLWLLGAAASVAALVGGSALVQRGVHAHRVTTCTAAGETIAEVWNPSARARIEASASLDQPQHILEAIERVGVSLDAYARQWSEARARLCVATQIDHELDPELARRAHQCLDAQRTRMDLLVEVLPELEGLALLRGAELLTHLPELAVCLDPAFLRGLPELPPGLTEDHEQALGELSTTLLRAEIARAFGRYDEALPLAEAALTDAKALGWPPLIAEATFALGQTHAPMLQPLLGAQLVEEAYFAAVEQQLDPLVVQAATWLVESSRDLAEAERWMRHARVALERLERPAEELLAAFERQTMLVAMRSGAMRRAVEIGEPLLPRLQAQLGQAHPSVQSVRVTLGYAYLQLGRVEQAIASFTTVIDLEQRWFGTKEPAYVPALLGLVEARRASGQDEQARTLLEQALRARESVEGPNSIGVTGILAHLGGVCEHAGQLELARDHYARELDTRQALGHEPSVIAHLHRRQARVLMALGERARALEHHAAAVELLVANAQFDATEALLHAQLEANERRELGDIDAALAVYSAALDAYTSRTGVGGEGSGRHPPPWATPTIVPRPPPAPPPAPGRPGDAGARPPPPRHPM